jgi:3'-phosphoadenosine 5'-phosphosulfate sulfotransferase (PAPS reductase)/FAD synthetase
MKENSNVKHLVMFSGGASSAYVAKWVVDKYGRDDVILFFTDTQWEDEDNYRFMEEAASYIGVEITRVVDGRTPEDVFFENRFLGNARHAQCSEELKLNKLYSSLRI